ncbi:MAG: hypothetical protein JO110_25265, partial [Acetobacteraceae bacterium]|nr:hypothetical protein [Acetobacteraceae bacterium]
KSILTTAQVTNLYQFIYDRWARGFIDKKEWQKAIDVYDDGLKHIPGDGLLTQNRAYCVNALK